MDVKKIAIVGTGSMGSMMSLLFADNGLEVSMYDPSEKNRNAALEHAKQAGYEDQVKAYEDYQSLCDSMSSPRVFLFSIPHGTIGDSIVDSLEPYISRKDIIIDASNEHYLATQRRQAKLMTRGVSYIGAGVSGGYQSARAGPSMSPSGDDRALDLIMPLLEKVAAKDTKGNPCVTKIGPGGSGHYVKMIHNGIEQGILSVLCEIWAIMHKGLGMEYSEIASTWEKWNANGELKENFLISIGVNICRQKDPEKKEPVLDEIQDKVVQDVDESEGTGVWTSEEGMRLHIPIPTIAAAHQFRLASADKARRISVAKNVGGALIRPVKFESDKEAIMEDLRMATYAGFLASFIQGLTLLAKADAEERWEINFVDVIGIWRAGCIIRSEGISDLLAKAFEEGGKDVRNHPLSSPIIAAEFKKSMHGLKKVVVQGMETDAVIPSLSATLEYIKYSSTEEDLPTEFMEAELDYFGAHDFDLKSEGAGKPVTGQHHFGWKAAKSVPEEHKIT